MPSISTPPARPVKSLFGTGYAGLGIQDQRALELERHSFLRNP
jgi:hypothetical protein